MRFFLSLRSKPLSDTVNEEFRPAPVTGGSAPLGPRRKFMCSQY